MRMYVGSVDEDFKLPHMYRGICIIRHPLGNEKQFWISRLLDYRGQFVW